MQRATGDWKMRLRNEFLHPLPGLSAQLQFAPPDRREQIKKMNFPPGAKQSAVALILSESGTGYPELLLIKRAEYPGVHSGQIALPGGKKELSDASMLDTALREVKEELGIQLGEDQMIGTLSPLHIPVSGYTVHPFVFALNQWPSFSLNTTEVSEVILADTINFFRNDVRRVVSLGEHYNNKEVPAFVYRDYVVWGATAMMLSEFSHLYRNVFS